MDTIETELLIALSLLVVAAFVGTATIAYSLYKDRDYIEEISKKIF